MDAAAALAALRAADPLLARAIGRVGPFRLARTAAHGPYEWLLRAIVFQQLSTLAARTILGRVLAIHDPGGPGRFPTPDELLATPVERLRAAGLSAAKAAAVRDLAHHTLLGTVPTPAAVHHLPDEEIVARVTAVRGIGRWTAEMLLIFGLGRPDVLPVGDLGIQKGLARMLGRGGHPTPDAVGRRGERWRPYRTVASWYLWRLLDAP